MFFKNIMLIVFLLSNLFFYFFNNKKLFSKTVIKHVLNLLVFHSEGIINLIANLTFRKQ